MKQVNVDLGMFQETKVNMGFYTHEYSGYRVVPLEAPSTHSGSGAMLYRAV